VRELLKPTGAEAIDAVLVFLHLLEANSEGAAEVGLAHPEHPSEPADPNAHMPCIENGSMGESGGRARAAGARTEVGKRGSPSADLTK
jgi:hypothetical protein